MTERRLGEILENYGSCALLAQGGHPALVQKLTFGFLEPRSASDWLLELHQGGPGGRGGIRNLASMA